MSAKFSCNLCKADIAPEDADNISRVHNGYVVPYVRASLANDTVPPADGCHLCIPCICKVLTEGKRPPYGDEIPF